MLFLVIYVLQLCGGYMIKRLFFVVAIISIISALPANTQAEEAGAVTIPSSVEELIETEVVAEDTEEPQQPPIEFAAEIDEALNQAVIVKEEFEEQANVLLVREPAGWNRETLSYMIGWMLDLPFQLPEILDQMALHGRVLGWGGSIALVLFVLAFFYSIFWQQRCLSWVERKTEPCTRLLPAAYQPYVASIFLIVTTALIPLIMLGLYLIIRTLITYNAPWFEFVGAFLWIWFGLVSVNRLAKELLTNEQLFLATQRSGRKVYYWVRFLIYFTAAIVLFYEAAADFAVRADVLAFMQYIFSCCFVALSMLLLMKRQAILSLFPEFNNPIYQMLITFTRRFYYPLLMVTVSAFVLWSIGYRALGYIIATKLWVTLIAFALIVFAHHLFTHFINRWMKKASSTDDPAYQFARSLKQLLHYVTLLATFLVIMNLLGLLEPLERVMSFSVFSVGDTTVHFWTILHAIVVLIAFFVLSGLLQNYLSFKIYPKLSVDVGLGFVFNTLIRYCALAIGFLVVLNIMGINLEFLLVFAGAIGLGFGLGMKNIAANIVSGFSIIFGRKIRKGDWIEVDGRLGVVTNISLRETRMMSRDNIEYLIPNASLITNTIINYTLTTPHIRIHLPVGVSYNADPEQVRSLLLKVVEEESDERIARKPLVRFSEYADSAIVFDLLFWIDVRRVAREDARSAIYFKVFNALKEAGIEIPFPQRDLHIRSVTDQLPLASPK
jgi:small-conductance mechanosensitive channel